jgi:hypothetical protein
MYIIAIFLFLTPIVLLVVGWNRALRYSDGSPQPNWRTKSRTVSLLVGSVAVASAFAFILAWIHSGGNPHGMGTPPGIWQILVRVFRWTVVGSVVLATIGKGKGRFLALGAVVTAVLADFAVIYLNMILE